MFPRLLLDKLENAAGKKLSGCTAREIRDVERAISYRSPVRSLPQSYKDMLSVMGRCAGPIMRDDEAVTRCIFYPDMMSLAVEVRQEGVELPDDAFVITGVTVSEEEFPNVELGHFIRLSEEDPVSVYEWSACSPDRHGLKTHSSIFEFVEDLISQVSGS